MKQSQRWQICHKPTVPFGAKGQSTQSVSSATPTEDDNTLQTTSFARIIDAISEGEIVGLVNQAGRPIEDATQLGLGVYLNGTPVMQPDGHTCPRRYRIRRNAGPASRLPDVPGARRRVCRSSKHPGRQSIEDVFVQLLERHTASPTGT